MFAFTLLSAWGAADALTWGLETAPTWIGLAILPCIWKRIPLPSWVVVILMLHALILATGGHWTYERVPFGYWLREVLALERNPFDRLGHVFQGITPALLAYEFLSRTTALRGRWLPWICISLAVAFSALYELFEWFTVILLDTSAEAFLGTQGDPFDAQADMLCAFIGASLATLLARVIRNRNER